MQEQEQKYLLKIAELFFRTGIKSVTMDHIAHVLGISKKTLYQWVSNKNDLVLKFVEALIANDQAAVEHSIASGKNAVEVLLNIRTFFEQDLAQLKSNILFDIQHYHPDAYELLKNHQNSFVKTTVKQNLKQGIEEGNYRSGIDIELTCRLHGHQIFNLFNEDWFPRSMYTPSTVIKEFLNLYLYSIVSEKGLRFLEKALRAEKMRTA
jgi:TetR/AcrR family transcriptional regulator, cholesterol catabolism regulator